MEKRGNTGYAEAWLRRMGYQPDTRMQGMVGVWFGWFAANNGWYHYRHYDPIQGHGNDRSPHS